jgi:hypothetical protein
MVVPEVTCHLHMAQLNLLRKSTRCCLSPPSPLKKLTGVLNAMIGGDGDHGGGVFTDEGDGGSGGGCADRSGVLGVGECAVLGRVQSVVLARVVVLSDLDEEKLKLLLALSDKVWDVATVADPPAGEQQLFTQGCVCQ